MRYAATAVDREDGAEVQITVFANDNTDEQVTSFALDPVTATAFVIDLEEAIADAECMDAGRWMKGESKSQPK